MAGGFGLEFLGELDGFGEIVIGGGAAGVIAVDDVLEALGEIDAAQVLLHHLIGLFLDGGAEVGDFDVLARGGVKLFLEFFEIEFAEIPGLAGLPDLVFGFVFLRAGGFVGDEAFGAFILGVRRRGGRR